MESLVAYVLVASAALPGATLSLDGLYRGRIGELAAGLAVTVAALLPVFDRLAGVASV
jgi:hypothetical protein